jgi:hypothetical protein
MKLAIFAKEDYRPLLPHCVAGIDRNVRDPITDRYLVSLEGITYPGFVTVTDEQLWEKIGAPVPMTLTTIAHAGNARWFRQQILKLGIDALTDDDTLVVDADLLFLRPVTFVTPPTAYLAEEFEPRYFAAAEALAGVLKIADLSFVTDFAFFRKSVLSELRAAIEAKHRRHWVEAIVDLPATAILSEYELYGNFELQKNPALLMVPPVQYQMDFPVPPTMADHSDLVDYLRYQTRNHYQCVSLDDQRSFAIVNPSVATIPDQMARVLPAAFSGIDLTIDFYGESPSTEQLGPILSKSTQANSVTLITSSLAESTPGATLVRHPFACFRTLRPSVPALNTSAHFLLLMRVPKRHRIILGAEIFAAGLDKYGRISCCSYDATAHDMTVIHRLLTDAERKRYQSFTSRLPLLLDGPATDFSQYDIDNPQFAECLINVVSETAYERIEPEPLQYANWEVLFLTEKTAKPFVMFQIPIWSAVQGTAAAVRDLGFDIFDDLIDHSYDNEPDPRKRISMVVQELARCIAQFPATDLNALRRSLEKRFKKNFVLAMRMIKNAAQ